MMIIINFLILLIFVSFMMKKYNYYYLIILMIFMLMYLFFLNYNMYWMMIYSNLGFDKFSLGLIILLFWIFILMIFVSFNVKNLNYYLILLSLLMILFFSFSFMNLFMFYLFFEMSLIPIFIFIMGWGYQPERIKASLYMMMYTLLFSLPFLFILFFLLYMFMNLNFLLINQIIFESLNFMNFMIYFYMFMVFFVKLPMFLVHNWLPKAHVEAPVTGSMILAALMLKLGGYGLLRLMMMMHKNFILFNDLVICLSFMGMVFLSMLCIRISDMKVIVAYSSVIHMGMMLLGFLSLTQWGLFGGFMMMLAHGLCSSGMFLILNYFYLRSKSRNIYLNKGLNYFFSSFMMLWFILCVDNMGAPISLNLISEVSIIMIILNWSNVILLILIISMFFCAIYNLYLFSFSFHGNYLSLYKKIYMSNIKEFYSLILHLIPLNLLIFKLSFIY
uniref:NADH-ubiquinone oxidoreductase chain 4 n=1 Tax=Encyrtus aurantii TaxID=2860127 RepID=A0AA50W7N0_9HYME|nr:NADH dehydrogenase subunit 4 [Encyrtus aurantii]